MLVHAVTHLERLPRTVNKKRDLLYVHVGMVDTALVYVVVFALWSRAYHITKLAEVGAGSLKYLVVRLSASYVVRVSRLSNEGFVRADRCASSTGLYSW